MKLYDEKETLYLEIDASGVALAAGLLQVREGMACLRDTTWDNPILSPIASGTKSLSSVQKHDTVI